MLSGSQVAGTACTELRVQGTSPNAGKSAALRMHEGMCWYLMLHGRAFDFSVPMSSRRWRNSAAEGQAYKPPRPARGTRRIECRVVARVELLMATSRNRSEVQWQHTNPCKQYLQLRFSWLCVIRVKDRGPGPNDERPITKHQGR